MSRFDMGMIGPDPQNVKTKLHCNVADFLVSQAALRSSAIIAIDSYQSLSFGECNFKANQIAALLIDQNVTAGDVIALYPLRSSHYLPLLFGILKAGCTYLPISTDWPAARLQAILKQAGCQFVLGPGKDINRFALGDEVCILDSSSYASFAAIEPPKVETKSPAYIIFTSGSTGQPKGVSVSHSNLNHLLVAMVERLNLDAHSRFLCLTAFSFDLSIPDLFLPCLTGGSVYIAENYVGLDTVIYQDIIDNQSITHVASTPQNVTRLHLYTQGQKSAQVQLLVGGDKLSVNNAKKLIEKCARLWHCYGPTEATVWASITALDESDSETFIDHFLNSYAAYIRVDDGATGIQGLPPGSIGELLIAGSGLANGYYRDAERTDQSFPLVQLNNEEVVRCYLTGDIVKVDENQRVSFVGRKDNQVKLHGYRVELGEVESVASTYSAMAQCIAHHEGGRLIIYYQLHAGSHSDLDHTEFRQYLAQHLPWYMLPQTLTKIESWPLTSNGKIDKTQLRTVVGKVPKSKTPDDYSSNRLLEPVIACWRSVLDMEIYPLDNFFDIDGNSIKATQILLQLEKKLQINLSASLFYTHPTPAEMANVISKRLADESIQNAEDENGPVVLIRPGSSAKLICFHAVGGAVLNYRVLQDYVSDTIAIYGVQARGNYGKPHRRIPDMASYYSHAIKEICKREDKIYLAGGSMGGIIALEVAGILQSEGFPISRVFMFDTYGPRWKLDQSNLDRRIILKEAISRKWALMYARFRAQIALVSRGKLPNEIKYQYMDWIHRRAVDRYFQELSKHSSYSGKTILITQPNLRSTDNTDGSMGWSDYIKGPLHVEFVKADHEGFIESDEFGEVFGRLML